MPSAELPPVAWQVEHSIAAGKAVVKCPRAWLAKGLVKAKCFVGNENGRRGVVLRTSGVKGVRGFVGFAACQPFEARQTAWALWANGLVAQNGCCGLR